MSPSSNSSSCQRKGHRYDAVEFFISENNGSTNRRIISKNASTVGALFDTEPWGDFNKLDRVEFKVNGFYSQVKSPQDFKKVTKAEATPSRPEGSYIVEYSSVPATAKIAACGRCAHRERQVVFVYKEGNAEKNIVALDASLRSAVFDKKFWADPSSKKDLKMFYEGIWFSVNIEEKKPLVRSDGKPVLHYSVVPEKKELFPEVVSEIKDTYVKMMQSIGKKELKIPFNKTKFCVMALLSLVIIVLMVIFWKNFTQIGKSPIELLSIIGGVVALGATLTIYSAKSQKDLHEYAKYDRRLAIANYLETVILTFTFFKDGEPEKAIDKLQKAGETLTEASLR